MLYPANLLIGSYQLPNVDDSLGHRNTNFVRSEKWKLDVRLKIQKNLQVSDNDKMIQPETEAWFAERINARKTIHLSAGHAAMASHSREVSALILEAAESI